MTETKNNGSTIRGILIGGLFIGTGLMFLAEKFIYSLNMANIWPFFMLVPIAILVSVWFYDKKRYLGVWFPVTILLFYMGYFLWLNFNGWYNAETTWPNFLIGPGLAFFVMYLLKKEWGYIIPAMILLILAGIFYAELVDGSQILSLGFIAAGAILIIRHYATKNETEDKNQSPPV